LTRKRCRCLTRRAIIISLNRRPRTGSTRSSCSFHTGLSPGGKVVSGEEGSPPDQGDAAAGPVSLHDPGGHRVSTARSRGGGSLAHIAIPLGIRRTFQCRQCRCHYGSRDPNSNTLYVAMSLSPQRRSTYFFHIGTKPLREFGGRVLGALGWVFFNHGYK